MRKFAPTIICLFCVTGLLWPVPCRAQEAKRNKAHELAILCWRDLNARKWDAAIKDGQIALEFDPYSIMALQGVYRAYLMKRDWDHAWIYCKRYLDMNPRSENTLKDASVICQALGRYKEASIYRAKWRNRKDQERAASYPEGGSNGPQTLAVLEHVESTNQTKMGSAVTPALDERVNKNPRDEDLRFSRTQLLWYKRDYARALKDLLVLLKAHPDDTSLHMNCAHAYLYLKKYAEGAREYRQVLSMKPVKTKFSLEWWAKDEIYARCAECYAESKQYGEAIKVYTEALKYDPDDQFYEKRADCYLATDQLPLALADYSKAVELSSFRGSRILLKRASVYEKLGMPDKAQADKERAAGAEAEAKLRRKEMPPGIEGADDLDQLMKFARPAESGGKSRSPAHP